MSRRFRGGSRGASILVLIGAAFCSPGFAQAATPTVAWQINQSATPTNLVPASIGNHQNAPQYEIFVTNLGGASSEGGVMVTDDLPIGVEPAGEVHNASAPFFIYARRPQSTVETGDCGISGQIVSCEISAPVQAGTSFVVSIPLKVDPDPPGSIENVVTVEGGGATESSSLRSPASGAVSPFDLLEGPGLSAGLFDEVGDTPVAGAHPFEAIFNVGITTSGEGVPSQSMRTVRVELPDGLVVNPSATPANGRCTVLELIRSALSSPAIRTCSPESQIGDAYFTNKNFFKHGLSPLYNVVPPPGAAAALAFEVSGSVVVLTGGLTGGFRLTAESREILSRYEIFDVAIKLWGVPSDSRHDSSRQGGETLLGGTPEETVEHCMENAINGCPVAPSRAPFLTAPTSCTQPLAFSADVTSWLGGEATATRPLTDREFNPAHVTGCNQLAFEPTISSQATTNAAETSSGLDFSIHQPQDESLGGRSTAAMKDATVSLPEGMSLNPSAANGLSSCTEQQMGYAPEEGKIFFETTPNTCPNAAKVGTLSVHTPLLEEDQPGAIYVAKPFDNPFGSLLAIYLAVEDEETGIIAKLAGKVTPDPATGRLTATFTENPELPLEDIDLHFFNGARGVLTTPLTCGTKTTTSTLTPWSTPEGVDVHPSGSFATTVGCSASEAAAPKTVAFTAGTTTPLSGAFSPFVLRLSRPDGSQHITGIDTTLPEGLLGKLAGVAYCPESGIAQAISREVPEQGKAEQGSPSCPQSSEVGSVQVTAGSGITPIPVNGHAYLAGPYKGAPLSLVVIVPAVAGPFDLGTVVDRVALNVGEYDARIHAVADPLPTIRDGIPLDVRSIELKLDRPGFTLNPTSCEVASIEGSVSTQAGQTAPLNNRFQVGECGRLAFKPSLKLSLKGQTKRNGHPALKAVLTVPKKGSFANIAKAQVGLPHSEFLDQGNIGSVCTQPQLKADACPKKAIYGHAKAWTPLLDKPLEGPVYLGVGFGHKLPDLVADLNGQLRILLHGKVDTDKQEGIRNTFETVPDAPVSKFILEMKGGKKGLIVNSTNICKGTHKAEVDFKAQNGKTKSFDAPIANSCGKGGGKKGKGKKKGKAAHGKKKPAQKSSLFGRLDGGW
jgi:hypothetical protein